MLITPAVRLPGSGWIMFSEEHLALLGIIFPLKYSPPKTLLLLTLGPNPVRQRPIMRRPVALIYE